jgi:hypothetical protein
MSRERLRRRLTGLAKRRTTHKAGEGARAFYPGDDDDMIAKEAEMAQSEVEQGKGPPRLFKPLSTKTSRPRGVSVESKQIAEQDGFGSDVSIRVIDCGIVEGEGGKFELQTVSAQELLKVLIR